MRPVTLLSCARACSCTCGDDFAKCGWPVRFRANGRRTQGHVIIGRWLSQTAAKAYSHTALLATNGRLAATSSRRSPEGQGQGRRQGHRAARGHGGRRQSRRLLQARRIHTDHVPSSIPVYLSWYIVASGVMPRLRAPRRLLHPHLLERLDYFRTARSRRATGGRSCTGCRW